MPDDVTSTGRLEGDFGPNVGLVEEIYRAVSRRVWAMTSWPRGAKRRLMHGECVPASMAILFREVLKNNSIAPGVVATRPSLTTAPSASNVQKWLNRSPRSIPTVTTRFQSMDCRFTFAAVLACAAFALVDFFTAHLLSSLCLEHVKSAAHLLRLRLGGGPSHLIRDLLIA